MTVPAGLPRRLVNLSTVRPALIHVSLAAAIASTNLGKMAGCPPVEQPASTTGRPGAEQTCAATTRPADSGLAPALNSRTCSKRRNLARRESAAVTAYSTPALDFPAIVLNSTSRSQSYKERRHVLSSEAATRDFPGTPQQLVPKGLCHYFINLTLEPMAMIWVYAGDKPDRIVMDEGYCHPEKSKK